MKGIREWAVDALGFMCRAKLPPMRMALSDGSALEPGLVRTCRVGFLLLAWK